MYNKMFFLAERCPSAQTFGIFNEVNDDSFIIDVVLRAGESPVVGDVLDGDGVQLPNDSTLEIRPNEDTIKRPFTPMKLTMTVTGGTNITLTFYDENNTPLPNPVTVSTSLSVTLNTLAERARCLFILQ